MFLNFRAHFVRSQDNRYLNEGLAYAARSGNIASVRLLLEHGADATTRFGGQTCLDFAKTNKIKALIQAHLAGDSLGDAAEDVSSTMRTY